MGDVGETFVAIRRKVPLDPPPLSLLPLHKMATTIKKGIVIRNRLQSRK